MIVRPGETPEAEDRIVRDLPALARLRGTIVLMMAVKRIDEFATALLEGGRPADTPVALVIDHPNYQHTTTAPDGLRASLAGDYGL